MTLYAYGPLDVPEGVKLGDASDIISSKETDAFLRPPLASSAYSATYSAMKCLHAAADGGSIPMSFA